MFVVKRDGRNEPVSFDKVTARIRKLSFGLNVDPTLIAQKVIAGVYPGVTTVELDNLAAETSAFMSSNHTDYGLLAGRIAASNLQKQALKDINPSDEHKDELPQTGKANASGPPEVLKDQLPVGKANLSGPTHALKPFSKVAYDLYHYVEPKTGMNAALLSTHVHQFISKYAQQLDAAIVHDRDLNFDFFGFKTLLHSYLLKLNGQVAETPQYMFMRASCGIHIPLDFTLLPNKQYQGREQEEQEILACIIETYNLMSDKWFTHASPTLFNSGTPNHQLSSCFLVAMKSDSIEGIYDTLKECAMISKSAGGIGLHISNIRCSGSYIKGTNGVSNGIIPMLRVFNDTARYVDQGGGKRKGAFAIYLEPWHGDVFEFLDLRKNTGKEEVRARDLFLALWIPDLFMERVFKDEEWSLMCPHECPGLQDAYGEKFNELYTSYESQNKFIKKVKARALWDAILVSQMETGVPYILYKDACNLKSNQKNLGTIKSSNLCCEILEYSSSEETAVCNLASISLPRFVMERDSGNVFDFKKLYEITKIVTRNLNKVIDVNKYPCESTRKSNLAHRPIAIGVQGLADTFIKMRFPYSSPESIALNKQIFETIYYASLEASMELARTDGAYTSFRSSPLAKGKFQFDLWDEFPPPNSSLDTNSSNEKPGNSSNSLNSSKTQIGELQLDWEGLRQNIKKHGVRNSLLTAIMPTASTSSIFGNIEAAEVLTSNIYTRRVLSGEFIVFNSHLLKDLIKLGLWNDDMKNKIVEHNGSIQAIKEVPQDVKELYKTTWEVSQRNVIDMYADRGRFIDQTQSMNLHLEAPTNAKLNSMHFYSWKKGLKTGIYYLRSKSKVNAVKFTLAPSSSSLLTETKRQLSVSPKTILKSSPTGARGFGELPVATPQTLKDEDYSDETQEDGPVCTMQEGCLNCGS